MSGLARYLHHKGADSNDFDLYIFGTCSLSDKEVVSTRDVVLTTRSQWKRCSDDNYGKFLTRGWVEAGNYKLGVQPGFVSSMKG